MFTELANISDQLHAYMQEAASIIGKLENEYNLTKDQAIEVAKIATQEMMADCLFHIDKDLQDISGSLDGLDCAYALEQIANNIDYQKKEEK